MIENTFKKDDIIAYIDKYNTSLFYFDSYINDSSIKCRDFYTKESLILDCAKFTPLPVHYRPLNKNEMLSCIHKKIYIKAPHFKTKEECTIIGVDECFTSFIIQHKYSPPFYFSVQNFPQYLNDISFSEDIQIPVAVPQVVFVSDSRDILSIDDILNNVYKNK